MTVTSRRSYLNRTFGPLERGSMRGSMLQLSAAAIGAGVLNLPYVMSMVGFVNGIVFILIAAFAAQWSLKNILYCAEEKQAYSYTSLVRKIVGRKADRLMTVLILISISGSCITEQIVVVRLIQTLLENMGFNSQTIERIDVKGMIMFLVSFFVIFPMALTRRMSGFRYMSVLTMASLAYILVALLIELPLYFEHNFSSSALNYGSFDLNLFTGAAITMFSFSCHIEILPVYDELQNPTERRVNKVVNRSVFINTIFYLFIGLAGYFSTFSNTKSIVIIRDPIPGGPSTTGLMLVAMVLIIFILCLAYPMNFIPLRTMLLYKINRNHKYSTA